MQHHGSLRRLLRLALSLATFSTAKARLCSGFPVNGFEVVDTAPPDFELLVTEFTNVPSPRFKGDWDRRLSQSGSGLTVIRSDQCPYLAKSVKEIADTAERTYGIKPEIVERLKMPLQHSQSLVYYTEGS